MEMDSRRVSLPASFSALASSASSSSSYPQGSTTTTTTTTTLSRLPLPPMLLSPHFSSLSRRSLPSTPLPNGGRRSLPATPPTPGFSSTSDQDDDENLRKDLAGYSRKTRLRSFDLRDGHLFDKGYQKINKKYGNESDEAVDQNYLKRDFRRATCPDIFLFDSSNQLMRHVVLRIYGARNCGKKTLANRIHHFATSMAPDNIYSDDENIDWTKPTNFLLNGREITLEILLESSLENSPFRQSKTIYVAMYNVDSRQSFNYATHILKRISHVNELNHNLQSFLIANKIDLKRNQIVSSAEGRSASKLFKCEFAEISALLGMNIEETWKTILQQIHDPSQRRRPSWVERMLKRGKGVAKSAEEVFHRMF